MESLPGLSRCALRGSAIVGDMLFTVQVTAVEEAMSRQLRVGRLKTMLCMNHKLLDEWQLSLQVCPDRAVTGFNANAAMHIQGV